MTANARTLMAVLFLIGLPLWAQNQRLTWVGDEYAMRYEVVIEKEEEGAYSGVLREFTEESFIEVSLPSGKYRCQVTPYDFLNQPVPAAEWVDFEVLSNNAKEIIMVKEAAAAAPEPEQGAEYNHQFSLYLSAAWILLAPLYEEGEGILVESAFFGENASISPASAAARLGVVSAKRRLINAGVELTALWHIRTLLFDVDMIQRLLFSDDKAAVNFRLGAGVSLLSGENSLWAAGEQYATHFNAGASLVCFISKNIFMDMGVEYSQFFTKDFFCFLRSWIGLGYQF